MNKLIVITGKILAELTEFYENHGKYKGSENNIFDILETEFIQNNGKLFFRTTKEGFEFYSKDLRLISIKEDEGRVLKVFKMESLSMHQYLEVVEKTETLEGPFEFMTEDEAKVQRINTQNQILNDKQVNSSSITKTSQNKFRKLSDFTEYWDDIDLLKKYEMLDYEEKLLKSLHSYSKMDIDYNKNEVTLSIIESDYVFQSGSTLFLCTKQDYEFSQKNLPTHKPWKVGIFKKYKNGKKKIIIEITPEAIEYLMEKKDLKQGYVYFQDIGFLAKQNKESKALRRLFHKDTPNIRMRSFFPETQYADLSPKILNDDLFSPEFHKLDVKQKEAIKGSLQAQDIYLIQGPPGTGKTTVICEIISYLIKDKKRVLLSSQTNLAVDNVLKKIGDKQGVKAIRIGKEERIELGIEKFTLENCAAHVQKKMMDGTFMKSQEMERLLIEDPLNPYMFELHQKVQILVDELMELANVSDQIRDKKSKEEDFLKLLLEKQTTLQQIIDEVDYLRNGKLDVMTYLQKTTAKLGLSYDKLRQQMEIYDLTQLTPDEENLFKLYEASLKNANIGKQLEEQKELEKLRLEESKKYMVAKLNELNDEKRKAHRNQSVDPKEKEKLLNLSRKYNDDLNAYLELEAVDIGLDREIENIKNKNFNLVYVLQEVEFRIKPILLKQSDTLKELLNTKFLSKIRHIKLIGQSKAFREQFEVPEDDFRLLLKLEEFANLSTQLEELQKLENEILVVNSRIAQFTEELNKKENEKSLINGNGDYLEYLSSNQLTLENVVLDLEEIRCETYLQEYKEQERKRLLHKQTKEIKEDWIKALATPQQCFKDYYIKSANLIGATCLGIASTEENEFDEATFDYIIIDEAARATSSELLVPLVRGKTMILVGDHEQINPEIERSILARIEQDGDKDLQKLEDIYNGSLFGKLYEESPEEMKTFLNKQYRMHSGISKVVSQHFYRGELEDGEEVYKKRHGIKRFFGNSLIYVNTPKGKKYEEEPENTSYKNEGEVETVLSILKVLDRELEIQKTVGIIAPYRSQIQLLTEKIPNDFKHLTVEINTIDSFQGREMEIILLSLVRNNDQGRVGHIGEKSRLNVALSRAQELLVVVGHSPFFKKSSRAGRISNIIQEMEKGGKFFEAGDFA